MSGCRLLCSQAGDFFTRSTMSPRARISTTSSTAYISATAPENTQVRMQATLTGTGTGPAGASVAAQGCAGVAHTGAPGGAVRGSTGCSPKPRVAWGPEGEG